MMAWLIYAPMGTDPFVAVRDDGRRMVSSDLETIRRRFRRWGLQRFPRRSDDLRTVVEIWAKDGPTALDGHTAGFEEGATNYPPSPKDPPAGF